MSQTIKEVEFSEKENSSRISLQRKCKSTKTNLDQNQFTRGSKRARQGKYRTIDTI